MTEQHEPRHSESTGGGRNGDAAANSGAQPPNRRVPDVEAAEDEAARPGRRGKRRFRDWIDAVVTALDLWP